MDKRQDVAEESTKESIYTFVRLLLCTHRRWYFLLSFIFVLGIKYIYRPSMPMPVREYFTTYRIKYSDPGQGERASKSFGEEVYRPQWMMLNPYDRDMAIKYFESTKMVIDAGSKVNYTVRYWRNGQDVYEDRPVDIRFVSDSIDDFDSWTMHVDVLTSGVELSKIGGIYNRRSVRREAKIFVPYDKPTDTPLGLVQAKLIHPSSNLSSLVLTKMREVDAQDTYDAKMKRHMGGNLIELFLTSNCTRGFAHDFFHQIAKEYEAYARSYYLEELEKYLGRLDDARQQVESGHSYLEGLGIKTKASGPETRRALLQQLDKMVEEAQTNALVLSEGRMIEILDDTLIRSPKQAEISLPYVNLGLGLLFFLLPILALVIELALRRPILGPSLLPGTWAQRAHHLRLPRDLSSQAQWDMLAIELVQHLGKAQGQEINIADFRHDVRHPLTALMEAMPEDLRVQCRTVSALSQDLEGLKLLASQGVPLIVRLRNGFTPEGAVRDLYDWCSSCAVRPIILWDDRL